MQKQPFSIRPAAAAADDGMRLLRNFDSQLPWLASVGSGAQWGSAPRSNESYQAKYRSKVERSEACIDQSYLSPDWIRAYVAEVEMPSGDVSPELLKLATGPGQGDATVIAPVAGMVLEAKSADYIRSILPEQDEEDPFVYLSYLLSDRRTSLISKGAGAALIAHAKGEVRKLGIKRICCDCWRGNDRRLVK